MLSCGIHQRIAGERCYLRWQAACCMDSHARSAAIVGTLQSSPPARPRFRRNRRQPTRGRTIAASPAQSHPNEKRPVWTSAPTPAPVTLVIVVLLVVVRVVDVLLVVVLVVVVLVVVVTVVVVLVTVVVAVLLVVVLEVVVLVKVVVVLVVVVVVVVLVVVIPVKPSLWILHLISSQVSMRPNPSLMPKFRESRIVKKKTCSGARAPGSCRSHCRKPP
mmetsp:Transcript_41749/g.108126  ORF Transcript_41749/g.108126 Transcript_41749/m.108126 type:complete len:218 (+) Transcript_41749:163-816(+)